MSPPGRPKGEYRGARRLRILTWHVHGNYLYSLTQLPHDFVVPYLPGRAGYGALGEKIPWGENVRQVPADALREQALDCVIYQSRGNLEDAAALLDARQQALPCAYIEHNPPEPHPTDTVHPFRHERGVLVHVTHYNAAMWHAPGMPAQVIEHGVPAPAGPLYRGELARGIVVVNHLARRGRRVGADLYQALSRSVPLDLIGMDAQALGGIGEVPNMQVGRFISDYRFFFSPVRYASLGLSLVEAMLCAVPVVGFAATELPCVIQSGHNGYVDTSPARLEQAMRALLQDRELARQWGEAGRRTALQRFSMDRFVADWQRLLNTLMEAA
ncbi:glycosyltransferase family 4 protein [Orrella sp. JC864]|uniref:glycosyltransferase n=1 Tax=Orrella sp. JC864 TaxID=3120298 RepID=UPI0012BD0858